MRDHLPGANFFLTFLVNIHTHLTVDIGQINPDAWAISLFMDPSDHMSKENYSRVIPVIVFLSCFVVFQIGLQNLLNYVPATIKAVFLQKPSTICTWRFSVFPIGPRYVIRQQLTHDALVSLMVKVIWKENRTCRYFPRFTRANNLLGVFTWKT